MSGKWPVHKMCLSVQLYISCNPDRLRQVFVYCYLSVGRTALLQHYSACCRFENLNPGTPNRTEHDDLQYTMVVGLRFKMFNCSFFTKLAVIR